MTEPCNLIEREGLLDPEGDAENAQRASAHIAECLSCRTLWQKYQRIRQAMPDIGASYQRRPDYRARVFAAIARDQRRRRLRRWGLGFAAPLAALAIIAIVALRPGGGHSGEPLQIEISRGDGPVMRTTMVQVGDRVRAKGAANGAEHFALRIYRNQTELLLECPGDASCRQGNGVVTAEFAIATRGRYQVLWLTSERSLPAPSSSPDRDVASAADSGADYQLREIEVW